MSAADLAERRRTAHPPVLSNARSGPSGTGGVCAVRRHPTGPSAAPNEAVGIERSEEPAESEEKVDWYGPEAFDTSDGPKEPTLIQIAPRTRQLREILASGSHIARLEGRRLSPRISCLGLRSDHLAVQLVCADEGRDEAMFHVKRAASASRWTPHSSPPGRSCLRLAGHPRAVRGPIQRVASMWEGAMAATPGERGSFRKQNASREHAAREPPNSGPTRALRRYAGTAQAQACLSRRRPSPGTRASLRAHRPCPHRAR